MKLRASWVLAAVPLAFLLVLLVAPALRLAVEGGQLPWLTPWQDAYLRWRIEWSLVQALVTCVGTLLLGVPVAWVLARFEFAGRSWVMHALMLPFVVPNLVAAMGVLALLGPQGVVQALGGAALDSGPWLLLYGNLFFNLCLVVRACAEAFAQVSASRIAAARTLGATPWRVFWRVEWPAVAPWLLSALCLVFLYCASGFGLALVLWVLALVCAAPLVAIVAKAVHAGAAAWAVLWEAGTLHALWNSLRFTLLAVGLATLLGLAHACAARRSTLLRALALLPLVLSPVAVAFGLLLLYPQWAASLALLVGAYALLAYPFVAQSLAAGLDALPRHLGQVARSLGASPWRVFWRVTLPLLRPALRRGMAFAAATAVGEFAVTLFLSRPEWATLTTRVYEYLGRPGETNRDAALVLACLLMGLALLAFAVIESTNASLKESPRHA